MTETSEPSVRDERHERAQRQTMRWAEAAAEEGNFLSAARWLDTLAAVDDGLPPDYEAKRQRWMVLVRANRPG